MAVNLRFLADMRSWVRPNLFAGLLSCLALAACAPQTTAQLEAQRIAAMAKDISLKYDVCMTDAKAKAGIDFSRLGEKSFGFRKGSTPSNFELIDPEPLHDNDINAIMAYAKISTPCISEGVQAAGRIDPELAMIAAESYTKVYELYKRAYDSRPMSWGDFNTAGFNMQKEARSRLGNWASTLKGKLIASHRQELATRQAERERFLSEVGAVSEALAKAAVATAATLAATQATLASARAQAASQTVMRVPTQTNCRWQNETWTCSSW